MNTHFDIAEHAQVQFEGMQEMVRTICRDVRVMSWGARGWTNIDNKALRFRVSGHHHKGYVFITVNAGDLFDVYLTDLKGRIKETLTDIYLDSLIETIDARVEKIEGYKF